eukprot:gene8346-11290_t
MDDHLIRMKYQSVVTLTSLLTKKRIFKLWHRLSLIAELSTWKSTRAVLRTWHNATYWMKRHQKSMILSQIFSNSWMAKQALKWLNRCEWAMKRNAFHRWRNHFFPSYYNKTNRIDHFSSNIFNNSQLSLLLSNNNINGKSRFGLFDHNSRVNAIQSQFINQQQSLLSLQLNNNNNNNYHNINSNYNNNKFSSHNNNPKTDYYKDEETRAVSPPWTNNSNYNHSQSNVKINNPNLQSQNRNNNNNHNRGYHHNSSSLLSYNSPPIVKTPLNHNNTISSVA